MSYINDTQIIGQSLQYAESFLRLCVGSRSMDELQFLEIEFRQDRDFGGAWVPILQLVIQLVPSEFPTSLRDEFG